MTIKYPAGGMVSKDVQPVDDDSVELTLRDHPLIRRYGRLVYLVIHGEPVPAGRPRFTRQGHAFDPKRSRDYKKLVSEAAALQYHSELLHGIPLKVDVKVYRHVQSSISKVERAKRLSGKHRPIVKPDASNYLKLIEDALTGIVWEDDNLITDVSCSKYYSDDPRIEVTVTETGAKRPNNLKEPHY
ncbi:RusA family crossover junction endodeoxyribonuclease [Levilactobacillus sp. 244-2]|uniref:RusA family crossover junction endodeoxyribonuclease n=1 Tax=Levilactobacillus sp. 244-2 TaxID=2799569 RepID=UPI001EF3D4CF|nr:RusA family crossover junction endodeoxyribonuclease [Levilactobacillus sp. 244-2]